MSENNENYTLKSQVQFRLTTAELNQVNADLETFIVDIEGEVNAHSIFIAIYNRAISNSYAKKSLPADLEKIQQLEKNIAEYQKLQIENGKNADRLQGEVDELTGKLQTLSSETAEEHENLVGEIQLKAKEIESLQQQLSQAGGKVKEYTENPLRIVIDLTPAEHEVTEAFRSKLEENNKERVTIAQMLFGLFWEYIRKQNTQIAFPFFYSKKEIVKMLEKYQ